VYEIDERPDNMTLEDDVLLDQWLYQRKVKCLQEERKQRLEAQEMNTSGRDNIDEEFSF